MVSADRGWLLSLRPQVAEFLKERLSLEVSQNKTVVRDVRQGVAFLGAFLKPRRRYVSNAALRRMERKVPHIADGRTPWRLCSSLNSFLGLLSHYRCYHERCRLFLPLGTVTK